MYYQAPDYMKEYSPIVCDPFRGYPGEGTQGTAGRGFLFKSKYCRERAGELDRGLLMGDPNR